jgi:16S rRNA pseudouridine516 synthase
MDKQRLDRILVSTGRWSRKEIKRLTRLGRIAVDGVTAASSEEKYDPESAEIAVDGELIHYCRVTWLMMNKPPDVLSATEDGREKTVLDLLPPDLRKRKLFPVGRLDRDTEGLLLLTNDGVQAHRLLSPRYHVDKVYLACVDGHLTEEDCRAFQSGMILGDGLHCLPARLEILRSGGTSDVCVTLREGKYHQVKRMLAARGKPVLSLRRVRMGNLTLDPSLLPGQYRMLTEEEVKKLFCSDVK